MLALVDCAQQRLDVHDRRPVERLVAGADARSSRARSLRSADSPTAEEDRMLRLEPWEVAHALPGTSPLGRISASIGGGLEALVQRRSFWAGMCVLAAVAELLALRPVLFEHDGPSSGWTSSSASSAGRSPPSGSSRGAGVPTAEAVP
jgi:hypothetical protein